MFEEIWKEYTFKDGTVSIVKSYKPKELEWQILRHGEIEKYREVKVRRRKS